MVLLSSVNTMEADFNTQTTSPCPCAVSVQYGAVCVATSVSMCRVYFMIMPWGTWSVGYL